MPHQTARPSHVISTVTHEQDPEILELLRSAVFLQNRGLRFGAADSHPDCFTLGCKPPLCMLGGHDISVVDATTTSSEFVQRKRSASAGLDAVRFKEPKMEMNSETAARDDCVQIHQHDNMKELFEMMMQSVTSLAASLASSHSSSQPSEQLMPPAAQLDLHHLQTARGVLQSSRPKTEEQEVELLDQSDGEEECAPAASPRPSRAKRRSGDGLLEEFLRRMEAREAQRDREQRDDVTLFLLSLAPALRRLPAEKQSWIRTKIQQFVHEAEFGAASFQ
ncbi:uncharacterized protein LOC121963637 [Plectropomus leopardus]|uniref:uncharacterized protein LOC121963637 n=1 Tax=Plectropomus leopardus TaxID=160734 RepID=UPI001C4C78A8|nr:uncharacterized protein LOC121963637 [Plectropomus leopardus]